MSPALEELRNRLKAMADLANLTASSEETRSDLAKYLAALDALVAENAAAKARAEKAEAELEQANAVLRYATKTKDQYHSERDALRKALEPFAEKSKSARDVWGDTTLCMVELGDLRRAHAALHGTAKRDHIGDANEMIEQPKPRTCGECAKFETCKEGLKAFKGVDPLTSDHESCSIFQPRADAQKGANT